MRFTGNSTPPANRLLGGSKCRSRLCIPSQIRASAVRTGSSQNGASLNGATYSNGASNGAANGVVLKADFSDSHSSNGKSATLTDLREAEPVAVLDAAATAARNGNGASPVAVEDGEHAWADPCDVGQLEACAQERYAGVAAGARAEDRLAEQDAAATSGREVEEDLGKAAARSPYQAPGGRWSKFRSYSVWQRTFMIWGFAFKFFFKLWLVGRKFTYGKEGMTEARVSERRRSLAAWLREGLVKLGPTFIKIGQQFSTRVDVLSPEFVKELELLQDNVPAFSSAAAVATVERGLGKPITEVFEEFQLEPIAAASLGQVHLAKVDGERVVVKVQRPYLKEIFDVDLKNIRVLAQILQAVDPKSDGAARDWVAIYDECSRILYQEIDYELEGQNADRFRENFQNTPWIKVPKVLWKYTAGQVLTMEYAPGVKINRIEELQRMGVDRKELARRTVECYLQQLLTYGFFHADPHPGNIAVDAEGGGRLIYYDFGMMGTIPGDVRAGLLELFYGVYQKDPDRCIEALMSMGVLVPGGDRVAIRRTAVFFLNSFEERLRQQREEAKNNPDYGTTFKDQLTKDEKKARRKQILANIGEDLLVASADKPFRFPATFTFVVRSFTVLDGIGKGLDPRFDISEIAAPYARSLILEAKPQFAKLQQDFGRRLQTQNRAVVNLFRGPNMIEDVAGTMRRLEDGDLKLRVRALDAERALTRVLANQNMMTSMLLAGTMMNIGTLFSVSAMASAATASFVGASVFGFFSLINFLKVKNLEKKEAQLLGA
ncbi:Protein ACTIVITY OF BC1 COMPLEX KINASE 8, chloroplastic [Coccomyxa sp. Obi]|nr:Protein ACTIVITY OF BC1 COMPLEX KINASE 8, chloroplastic [Coccomyxa sp. Obi]